MLVVKMIHGTVYVPTGRIKGFRVKRFTDGYLAYLDIAKQELILCTGTPEHCQEAIEKLVEAIAAWPHLNTVMREARNNLLASFGFELVGG